MVPSPNGNTPNQLSAHQIPREQTNRTVDRVILDVSLFSREKLQMRASRTSFSPMIVPRKTTRVVDSFGFTLLAVHSTGIERGPVCVRMGSSVNMSSSTWTHHNHPWVALCSRAPYLQINLGSASDKPKKYTLVSFARNYYIYVCLLIGAVMPCDSCFLCCRTTQLWISIIDRLTLGTIQ